MRVCLVRPRWLKRAISHARVLGGERNSFNLLFRGGPCEVCGGRCFSRLTDGRWIERPLSGRKPVGTFARRNHWQAWALDRLLQHRGLNTWRCTNRWGMHVAVACLPDSMMAGGRVRDLAFRCAFVDDPLCVRGLYGYPWIVLSSAVDIIAPWNLRNSSSILEPARGPQCGMVRYIPHAIVRRIPQCRARVPATTLITRNNKG